MPRTSLAGRRLQRQGITGKSYIEIDYLQKILYVIFTSRVFLESQSLPGACKMCENGKDNRGVSALLSREIFHGAWGGNRTRTALGTEGF